MWRMLCKKQKWIMDHYSDSTRATKHMVTVYSLIVPSGLHRNTTSPLGVETDEWNKLNTGESGPKKKTFFFSSKKCRPSGKELRVLELNGISMTTKIRCFARISG